MIRYFRYLRSLLARLESGLSGIGELQRDLATLQRDLATLQHDLDTLRHDVDYVRHVAEQTRANAGLAARSRPAHTPVRVYFLIHHLEAWYSLADVYAEMAAADDFLPLVASIPRRFPGAREFQDEELVHDGLTKFGIPHIRLRSDDSFQDLAVVRAFSPDVVFRQSQWDLDVPDAFTTNELAFARLCLVPYEPMGLVRNPADSAINPGYDCAYYRQAWRVFLANDLARDEVISQAPATRPDQYVVTGHPKADLLRRKITLGTPGADRPFTILWSAHHSIDDHWVRFGMFHRMALDMVEMAQRHPEWRFVLSLHPALAVKLESADPPLDADFVAAFWRDWNGLPNTSLFPGGDYGPLFANTDALLCDGLSWLLEYQLAGKPVVFLQREGHRPFNALGKIALTGMNQVDSLPIAEGLFEQFAAGRPDPHKPAQAEVVAALFGSSGAASRIVAAIRTGLVAD